MTEGPADFLAALTLADNKANGGQNPSSEPTCDSEPAALYTIGNRGA